MGRRRSRAKAVRASASSFSASPASIRSLRAGWSIRGHAGQPDRAARRQDIVATARPDILDRNGEVLATDVRMPSLFGEPRRIIDVDEAVSCSLRRCPT